MAERRLRADAEANLTKILDAAEAVFDEFGPDVSIERVAERAGLGLGTIYRRFRNKEELLRELVRRLLNQVVEIGERHAGSGSASALEDYMVEVGRTLSGARAGIDRMWGDPAHEDLVARSRAAQEALVVAAKDSGTVRPELTAEDVAVALWSVYGVLEVTRGTSVDAASRHIEILLAGWRPADALRNSPITPVDIDRVIAQSPKPTG